MTCLAVLVLLAIAGAVAGEQTRQETLIGTPITEPAWSPQTRARLEKDLEIAQAVMAIAPEREDSWIWLGRRLGYLARYTEKVTSASTGAVFRE